MRTVTHINEKPCTCGAQFLEITNGDKFFRTTNKTLIYNCESDRSGNSAMQHDFKHCYFGIYEEFEMLRCRLKRRARFLEAIAERNSPKASAFRNSVYDQTRDWRNTITQEDVKARTGQGIINKSHIETEMRNKLFDVIGETLIPGDKEAAHNLGLLLKHHIDEKEQKKQAKEQRLRDAQTIVQVAAAAAACRIYTKGSNHAPEIRSAAQKS